VSELAELEWMGARLEWGRRAQELPPPKWKEMQMVGRKVRSKRRAQLEPARVKYLRERVRVGRVSSRH
jgi:hypothetical protein